MCAAPLGNRFAAGWGWKSGRPPKYETPEQMLPLIQEYFDMVTTKTGICKPTISGLIFHLGFADRSAWYKYMEKQEFRHTLKKVETFIEACYEQHLHNFNWAGAAFALRNIRGEYWKDETTVNNNNKEIKANFGSKPNENSENNSED